MDANDIFKGMEGIRKEYLINILEQGEKIKTLFLDGNIQNHLPEIRTFAHQISGSGSSYGFEFITEAGRSISSGVKNEEYQDTLKIIQNLLVKIKETVKTL
ncbi:MAG TPA: hypothetical protein DHW82_00505 [Spirochaetia bacterium]|nr:MAG: hypothetical protein A2Y41_05335 [Spirochaetes bacterium GWB1_36_13]HCL55480.1 hypothetical protein [Spirochaetia bacterium]